MTRATKQDPEKIFRAIKLCEEICADIEKVKGGPKKIALALGLWLSLRINLKPKPFFRLGGF